MALLINKIMINPGENHSRIDQNDSISPMKTIIMKNSEVSDSCKLDRQFLSTNFEDLDAI